MPWKAATAFTRDNDSMHSVSDTDIDELDNSSDSESDSSVSSESDTDNGSNRDKMSIVHASNAPLQSTDGDSGEDEDDDEDEEMTADAAELRLQRGIALILNSPHCPGTKTGHTMSIRQAALKVGCSNSTLRYRWNGGQPRSFAHGSQQKVAPAMESALVEWIVELGRRGIPATRSLVMEKAESIAGTALGDRWYERFKKRHANSLAPRWTRSLETARAQGLNKSAVSEFFQERERLLNLYNIRPENDYNLDEKGILNGQGDKARVLVDRQQKNVYQIHSGGRELSTVIECFAASGKALRPTLIHKGKRLRSSWFSDNPGKFSIMHSPRGWTDREAFDKYMRDDFDPQSREGLSPGAYRMLTLDGHNSHISLKVVSFCEANRIVLMNLPPHTTHALQPCNVGIFGPLAAAWRKVVGRFTRYGVHIGKEDIPSLLHQARETSITPDIIRKAWAQTGLHPLNPNAVHDDMYQPAKNSSRKAAQPIPATLPPFLTHAPSGTDSGEAASNDTESLEATAALGPAPALESSLRSELVVARGTSHALQLAIADLPPPFHTDATRRSIAAQNATLRSLLQRSLEQHQRDHALKILMDEENGILRAQLNRRKKKAINKFNLNVRHLTADAAIDHIARAEWARNFRAIWAEGKRRKKWVKQPDLEEATKKSATVQAQEQRAAGKVAREEQRREKEMEKERKKVEKEMDKARKVQEREAERERKAAEKAQKGREREEALRRKGEEKARRKVEGAGKRADIARCIEGGGRAAAVAGKSHRSQQPIITDTGDQENLPPCVPSLWLPPLPDLLKVPDLSSSTTSSRGHKRPHLGTFDTNLPGPSYSMGPTLLGHPVSPLSVSESRIDGIGQLPCGNWELWPAPNSQFGFYNLS